MPGTTVEVSAVCRFEISPAIEPVVSIRKNTSRLGILVENSSGLSWAPAGSWNGSVKKKSWLAPVRRYATTVTCAGPVTAPTCAVRSDTCAPAAANAGMASVAPVIAPTAGLATSQVA